MAASEHQHSNIRTFWYSEYFYYVTLHYCATTIAFDQAGIIIVALKIGLFFLNLKITIPLDKRVTS